MCVCVYVCMCVCARVCVCICVCVIQFSKWSQNYDQIFFQVGAQNFIDVYVRYYKLRFLPVWHKHLPHLNLYQSAQAIFL